MTKEELIKNQFPNDEFLQSGVSQIVDKCIATLEKENAELKELLEACKQERIEALYRNEQYIKENAELKHTIATSRQEKDNVSMHAKAMEVVAKTRSNQLTKAKEIIKELVRVEYADFTNGDYSNELSKVLKQAEQFLSEVEK